MANTKKATTSKTSEKKTTKRIPKIKVIDRKKIIFLASEAAPFIATGGLADVIGSLPKSLAKRGNLDVSVILPLYSNILEDYKKDFKF